MALEFAIFRVEAGASNWQDCIIHTIVGDPANPPARSTWS